MALFSLDSHMQMILTDSGLLTSNKSLLVDVLEMSMIKIRWEREAMLIGMFAQLNQACW